MRYLQLGLAYLLLIPTPVLAHASAWEDLLNQADQAFRQRQYLQAKVKFSASLREARKLDKERDLAHRLECFAARYGQEKRHKVAEALRKKARQICRRSRDASGFTPASLFRKYVRALHGADREDDANYLPPDSETITAENRLRNQKIEPSS